MVTMDKENDSDLNKRQISMDLEDTGRKSPSSGSSGAQTTASASSIHSVNNDDDEGSTDMEAASGGGYLRENRLLKSFRHFTKEVLPRLENYRNMLTISGSSRPSLDELHNPSNTDGCNGSRFGERRGSVGGGGMKFGWIKGVLVRCLLCIWGVMLFLRLSWVTGQGGIIQAWLIILLATAATFITSLSMSAISTNGQIKGGGTYYMISRSLGPEFGASIGLIFSVANAVAVSMYVVGFAESLVDLLESLGTYVVADETNSVRIIGTVTVIVLTCVVVVGMEWEATAQVGLLIILLAAMIDFVVGSFLGPLSDEEYSKGFVGYNSTVLMENLYSDYRATKEGDQNFFSAFAIFFPAATGILAGANISGDLKDPQDAIPKGTLLSILITTCSYLLFAFISGATVVRDATGNWTVPDWAVNNSREYIASTFSMCTENGTEFGDGLGCKWGLMNSFQVMELVSATGFLIYAGCFAATLSSALASLVSAPKVFQALCSDKLYPGLEFFAKGYGKNNEPVRGYILTFVVALAFVLVAQLNYIAPLISNFFLAAYALVNFSTFHASFTKPIGWRPTFRYYNTWLSLVGFILCVAIMFLISWQTALVTFAVVLFLYLVVLYRKPEVNWGSTTQGQRYTNALSAVQQLNNVDDHVKNYRPQILLLSGHPSHRPPLIDFANLITKNLSLLMCGDIRRKQLNLSQRNTLAKCAQEWFRKNKIQAFYKIVDDADFETGSKALLQCSGVGKLAPKIVMMGFKQDWQSCDQTELIQYFNILHKALDLHLSVSVLRLPHGLDFSSKVTCRNFKDVALRIEADTNTMDSTKKKKSGKRDFSTLYTNVNGTQAVPKDLMDRLTQFKSKYKHGTIDVYWLYDDGGLTLLLPYIINSRKKWSQCRLRVFALTNRHEILGDEQRKMAEMLAKFRIDFTDLIMVSDYHHQPKENTVRYFNNLITPFRGNKGVKNLEISDEELYRNREKNQLHMRLRELVLENSRRSDLVVMTLPMPKKELISAPLYMAWLELLTNDMPPFLLVRGNQQSVLTFYS